MDNGSGQGKGSAVPADLGGWNWGAFLLTWIWGIGNNTSLAFLVFVPGLNVIMPFVLALNGSRWAWQNKRWQGVEQFKATQRIWAWAGLAALTLVSLMGVAAYVASTLAKHPAHVILPSPTAP